ncbi:unnamed protein product [Orchesella dallaii]|uniref:Death domain-containing protein n=1 Tax=Orchesella dallaii TaxID=48710 RepID=A0ABP1RBJ2_9HEXA
MDSLIVGNEECPFVGVCDALKKSTSVALVYQRWMELGRQLHVPPDKIFSIDRRLAVDTITHNEAIYQVLESWRSVTSSQTTLLELIRVLEYLELQDAADELKKAFGFGSGVKKLRSHKYSKGCKEVAKFLKSEETVMILSTTDLKITSDRIEETSEIPINFMQDDTFIEEPNYSNIVKTRNLIIIPVNTSPNISQVLTKVTKLKQKVILITNASQDKLMREFNNENLCFATDDIKWRDLTEIFQQELKQKCGILKNIESESLDTVLQSGALVELIQDPAQVKMKETLPPVIPYYIPRMLKSRFHISKNVFNEATNDVYVFTGLERFQLTEYAKEKPTDVSRKQASQQKISSQFILLQLKRDFEKICSKTDNPVHWLHHEKGHFSLIKSKGDMSGIQRYVENNQQEFTEDELLVHLKSSKLTDQSLSPVCISDSPGMGKSFLLANIGRNLVKVGHKVIFVVFEEFIRQLKSVYYEHEELLDAIIDVLVSTTFESKSKNVGFNILKHQFQSKNITFELLLDGLDEIHRDDLDLSYKCLSLMVQSFKAVRIWVATRLHLRNNVEQSLQVLGYNIVPFDKQCQVNFFVRYWSCSHNQQGCDLDPERLVEYSSTCLATLKKSMTNTEEDIAGVPLQCLLIAEVYEESAVDYADRDNVIAPDSFYAEFDIKTISELYEALFEKKIRKACQTGLEFDVEGLMKMHAFLSMKLMFPEGAEAFKNMLYPITSTNLEEAVLKVGILESTSNRDPFLIPRFVHRTFAEYFVGWFVIHSLEQSELYADNLSDFILQDVFRKFEAEAEDICVVDLASLKFTHKVTCYFINKMISKVSLRNSKSQFATCMRSSKYRLTVRDLALCSVNEDFENLFEFLDDIKVFELDSKLIFNSNLLFISIRHSSLPLVQLLLVHYDQVCETVQDEQSVLSVAVTRGDYSIVEFLVSSEGFQEKIVKMQAPHLLHDCVTDSEENSETVVSNKAQIIKLLVQINPMVLDEDYEGRKPIHCDCVHVKLLIELFHCGADVFSQNSEGDTVLHKAVDYLTPQNYFTMIKSIEDIKTNAETVLDKLVNIKGKLGLTPLHKLVGYKEIEEDTVKLFVSNGADFNSLDEIGDSLLTTAIFGRKDRPLLEDLIAAGADWKLVIEPKQRTMIHIAAEYGNFDAVKLLVSLGLDVNAMDIEGQTPLHSALFGKQKNRFAIWDYLIEHGADENVVEFDKEIMLTNAIKRRDWDSVKWFIEKNTDVNNAKDELGNTALHQVLALDYNQNDEDLARLLLKRGADAAALNNQGETPLLSGLKSRLVPLSLISLMESHGGVNSKEVATLALKRVITEPEGLNPVTYAKLAESCVRNGADVNYFDEEGNTLLHLAAAASCSRGVKYLLGKVKGLDFNSRNSQMNTPLHSAAENHDDEEVIKLLVKYGANLSSLNTFGYTVLHSAVKHRRSNISEFLVETGEFDELCGNEGFVLFTAEHRTLSTFKMVCEKFCAFNQNGKRLTDICGESPSCLHPAVRGGNTDIVKYLIHTHSFSEYLGELRMRDLVHILVRNSKQKWRRKEWAANEWRRDEILELLLRNQHTLLFEADSAGRVPLLADGVHVDLLQSMINLGADVKAVDANKDNILHLGAGYLSPIEYIKLMKLIIRRGEGHLLCSRGRRNSTVVQRLAEKMWGEVEEVELEQMLELFRSQNVDFNAVDDDGNTLLEYATKGNCEGWILEMLMLI